MRTAKTLIRLGGQTEWMPRLIWVFAGRTLTLLVLSCRGSDYLVVMDLPRPPFGRFVIAMVVVCSEILEFEAFDSRLRKDPQNSPQYHSELRFPCLNLISRFVLAKFITVHISEPQHYKTNKMTCAPSEDSDQPGHPLSLSTQSDQSLRCPHEDSVGP